MSKAKKTTKQKQPTPETPATPTQDGQDTPETSTVANNPSETPDTQTAPSVTPGIIARVLKVTKPLVKGDDVKFVQSALIARKFGCGVEGANGVYGASTALAVRQFQAMNRLIVNGRVDKFTAAALGATWQDPPKE